MSEFLQSGEKAVFKKERNKGGATNLGIDAMSPRKRRALDLYLGDRPEDLTRLPNIDTLITPPLIDRGHYSFPQTIGEFYNEVMLQDREYPDGLALSRVVRSLAMYAGVSPMGGAEQHFTVHKTLSSDIIHPTAQLRIAQRAARVRAIPPNWRDEPSLRTPLVVSPSQREGFVDISFSDPNGETRKLQTAKVLVKCTPMSRPIIDDFKVTFSPPFLIVG